VARADANAALVRSDSRQPASPKVSACVTAALEVSNAAAVFAQSAHERRSETAYEGSPLPTVPRREGESRSSDPSSSHPPNARASRRQRSRPAPALNICLHSLPSSIASSHVLSAVAGARSLQCASARIARRLRAQLPRHTFRANACDTVSARKAVRPANSLNSAFLSAFSSHVRIAKPERRQNTAAAKRRPPRLALARPPARARHAEVALAAVRRAACASSIIPTRRWRRAPIARARQRARARPVPMTVVAFAQRRSCSRVSPSCTHATRARLSAVNFGATALAAENALAYFARACMRKRSSVSATAVACRAANCTKAASRRCGSQRLSHLRSGAL